MIEVVVSIAIYTLVLGALYVAFSSFYRQQGVDIEMTKQTQSANYLLDTLGRELREANRAENGSFVLSVASASALTFYSDVDDDDKMEKVIYALADTDLVKTVIEPGADNAYAGAGASKTVVGNVQNATVFKYYDKDFTGAGSDMTAPINVLDVRTIGIFLDLDSGSKMTSYALHFETKINLRNI